MAQIRLIEVAPDHVRTCADLPEQDTSYVYEHLRDYCVHCDQLPAITVRVRDGGLVVVSGHKYLRVAQELHRRIRAIVVDATDDEWNTILAEPGTRMLDWHEIDMSERAQKIRDSVFVLHFAGPVTEEEVSHFMRSVRDFFENLDGPALEDWVGPRVYREAAERNRSVIIFRAATPADESWFSEFHQLCSEFSRRHVQIVSIQGHKTAF